MCFHELSDTQILPSIICPHPLQPAPPMRCLQEHISYRVGATVVADVDESNEMRFAVYPSMHYELPYDQLVVTIDMPQ